MRILGTTIISARHSAEINALQERETLFRKTMHEHKGPLKIKGLVRKQ